MFEYFKNRWLFIKSIAILITWVCRRSWLWNLFLWELTLKVGMTVILYYEWSKNIFPFKYIVVDYLEKIPFIGKKSFSFLFYEGKNSRTKISKSSFLLLSSFPNDDLLNIVEFIFVWDFFMKLTVDIFQLEKENEWCTNFVGKSNNTLNYDC